MNSAIFSITIPYIDMGKALESLKIDNSYAIIAMGVNTSFYSETNGFYYKDNNQFLYNSSNVYQIPASEPSIVIMKESELPFFKLCNNAQIDKTIYEVLSSSIKTIPSVELIDTVKISVPKFCT